MMFVRFYCTFFRNANKNEGENSLQLTFFMKPGTIIKGSVPHEGRQVPLPARTCPHGEQSKTKISTCLERL